MTRQQRKNARGAATRTAARFMQLAVKEAMDEITAEEYFELERLTVIRRLACECDGR